MPVFISLLRGINVGGNKKIAMAELRAVYESLGLAGARTLLQSGNVVFRADGEGETLAMLTGRIENAIEARFGFHVAVIMRTRDDLDGIITEQPFSAGQLAEPSKIAVAFLAETPTAAALNTLNEDHDGPEIIHSQGRGAVHLLHRGNGALEADQQLHRKSLEYDQHRPQLEHHQQAAGTGFIVRHAEGINQHTARTKSLMAWK
jgi:uncharacterized protein (DUF1697 family)